MICPKCGSKIKNTDKICAECGYINERLVDSEKNREIAAKKIKVSKIAAVCLAAVTITACALTIHSLSRNRFIPTEKNTVVTEQVFNDGTVSVTLEYDGNEFNSIESSNADLDIIIKNVSEDNVRDLSLSYKLPSGIKPVGQKESVSADSLMPGSARSYSIPVMSQGFMERNGGKLFLVIAVTVAVLSAIVAFFVSVSKKGKSLLLQFFSIAVSAAFALSSVEYSADAAENGKTFLIYNDSGEALGLAYSVENTEQYKLGRGKNGEMSITANYSLEKKLLLSIEPSEKYGVSFSWNDIETAEKYHLYLSDDGENFTEKIFADGEEIKIYEQPVNKPVFYRVSAELGGEELYSNTALMIYDSDGNCFADSDSDLITDDKEKLLDTSPMLKDSDGDGLSDYYETAVSFTNPSGYDSIEKGTADGQYDLDGDGLINSEEQGNRTDPLYSDTDGDGLGDKIECESSSLNPLLPDIINSDEIQSTDVFSDSAENFKLSLTGTAGDISKAELHLVTGTLSQLKPLASQLVCVRTADSTEGTVSIPIYYEDIQEGVELAAAVYNPKSGEFIRLSDSEVNRENASASVALSDEYYLDDRISSDVHSTVYGVFYADNLPYKYEVSYEDTDGDGIADFEELLTGTLPWCEDTDGDGLGDGVEFSAGYNPLIADDDNDGLNDYEEYYFNAARINSADYDNAADMITASVLLSAGSYNPYMPDRRINRSITDIANGILWGGFGTLLEENGIIPENSVNSQFYTLGTELEKAVSDEKEKDLFSALSRLENGKTDSAVSLVKGLISESGAAADLAVDFVADSEEFSSASLYVLDSLMKANETYGTDFAAENLAKIAEHQIEKGADSLLKEDVGNLEKLIKYADLDKKVKYKSPDAVFSSGTINLDISNTALPYELEQAVSAELGIPLEGGLKISEKGIERFELLRVYDLEAEPYQNPDILENALKSAVEAAADYSDSSKPKLRKRLNIVISNSIVSDEIYKILSKTADYGDDRNVITVFRVYTTSDDSNTSGITRLEANSGHDRAIIIVPGIMGSELVTSEKFSESGMGTVNKGTLVWPPFDVSVLDKGLGGLSKDLLSDAANALKMLNLDSKGNSKYKIEGKKVNAGDSYAGSLGSGTKIYQRLTDEFDEDYDVVFYSYDWRESVADSAKELQDFINENGYRRVTFVCHSMGGIVTSYYLSMNEENIDKTGKVITLGTPYGGAPYALYTLQTGNFGSFEFLSDIIKSLALNMKSIYELIPYADSVNAGYEYICDADNGNKGLNLRSTESTVLNSGFNNSLYNGARKVEEQLYSGGSHVIDREDVNSFIIAGYDVDTLVKISMSDTEPKNIIRSRAGDGTVPLSSAVLTKGGYFNSPIYLAGGISHGLLMTDDDVLDLVETIIIKGSDTGKSDYNSSKIKTSDEMTMEELELTPEQHSSSENKTTEKVQEGGLGSSIGGAIFNMLT